MPNFEMDYDGSECGCQWVCFCHLKDDRGNIVFPEKREVTEEEERARREFNRREEIRLFHKYRHLLPSDFRP
ncbi:hypothetical protein ACFVS2_25985 [Brevibacillus sp. NPDC058079]|uniref:hypothetical protein n=1 Tax=Brevibacillus sp. NPDC058079 TaxID=3346330 RepID=UPI0036F120E1